MRSLRDLDAPGLVVEVTTAATPLGRDARRLQTDAYRDAGLFDGDEPFAFDADGLLTDDWTDDAQIFVAVRDEGIVGTARLLRPVNGRLPAFGHTDARCPQVAALEEVSGFAVSRSTERCGVAIHLIRAMWQDALLRGVEDFVALVEPSLYRYLTRLFRFDWRVVGEAHAYRKATVLPIAFRLHAPGDTMTPPVQRFMKAGLPHDVAVAFDDRMRLAATSRH
jgi:hypothetical protein